MRKFIPSWAKPLPANAKKVFSGIIYDVYQWPQQLFDGSSTTFEMLKRPDTVIIIPILTAEEIQLLQDNNNSKDQSFTFSDTPGPKLIITNQEQPQKGQFYSFPGGRIDDTDYDELAGAKRELLEETGLSFKNWKLIQVKQPLNKIDWLVYTFVATGLLEQTSQRLDAGERIQVQVLDFTEVMQLSQLPNGKYLQTKARNLKELLSAKSLYQYN